VNSACIIGASGAHIFQSSAVHANYIHNIEGDASGHGRSSTLWQIPLAGLSVMKESDSSKPTIMFHVLPEQIDIYF
jgi:hypothetical protein